MGAWALVWLGAVACGPQGSLEEGIDPGLEGKEDSSVEASFLSFTFSGEAVVPGYSSYVGAKRYIQDQLLYTIGHLNGSRAVGRLDRLELSGVTSTSLGGGVTKIAYRAKLPVAWGSKTSLPTTYELTIPKDASASGFTRFTDKYKATCVDDGAHDVDSGSMWYYYRPRASGCSLDPADVVACTAQVAPSGSQTTGKFPEYHKVWEDQRLEVVAIFGKYEDGATTASDAGIAAYNNLVASLKTYLRSYPLTTVPATIPTAPGVGTPDITFTATLGGGKTVKVTALLLDNVATAGPSFNARYEGLSTTADLIMYNGHAGLGQNVRALARKGRFVAGKYLIVFMNGCDTYAYVDGYLAETRAALNPDDPTGTKYLDIVTNGMPSFFQSNSNATMAMLKGLLKHAQPMTYEQIFAGIDRSQVVLVTGEEDNVYFPGYPGPGGGFAGMRESGVVARGESRRYETPELMPGRYTVRLAHDPASPGGDADLYVKAGSAPTTSSYDCRPYASGSDEECVVNLSGRAKIHIMVNGYASSPSSYLLTVSGEGVAPSPSWAGLDEAGTVAGGAEKRWQTPQLPAGSYLFELSGTGDADLYTRVGAAPTTTTYDCRPYASGSNERCAVNLAAPGVIHLMVRGYATSSSFRLTGKPQ
jgi:hypothetical protein